jgi:hypothetical protein
VFHAVNFRRYGPRGPGFEDQLGLRLDPQQVPVEMLIVDHAEIPIPKK